jgi:hypothetical protein
VAIAEIRAFSPFEDLFQAGHRLVKTIPTVPKIGDVRGVAVSAVTGKLYVAYRNTAGVGMIYCPNIYTEEVSLEPSGRSRRR